MIPKTGSALDPSSAAVTRHAGLLVAVLQRFGYLRMAPDPEAVESAGLFALWRAIEEHDPARHGCAFSTFAVNRIRWACSRELTRQKKRSEPEVPLELSGEDGEPFERPEVSVTADPGEARAARQVAELLRRLPPRDAQLLALRFGIGAREHSAEETAALCGLSVASVRIRQSKALSRLRTLAAKRDVFAVFAVRQQTRMNGQSRQ